MKPWQVIFLCLLASALVFVSKCFSSSSSSSSSSLMFLPERRPRELSLSSFNQQDQYHKIQDVIRERRRRNTQGKGGSMGTGISRVEQEDSEDDDDSEEEPLNYHIDYHGVTTHPTPTPKHPKP